MKLYDVLRKEKGSDLKSREEEHYEPRIPPQRAFFILTRKKIFVILGVIVFLSILYVSGLKLVHAKVVITERRIPFSLAGSELELTNQEKADSGRLSFQAMIVNTTITREIYGSALTNSNTKATGTVVFFNEYSTGKQTVKKGTTLTSATGKKYTTDAAVTVPGYTTVNKKKVAGTSPSVNITASATGDSYNNSGTTLTASGWPSKTFYARSAAISGGEAGVSHTLTDSEREQAVTTLQTQLIERLKRETRAQIPEGYITFAELEFPIIDVKSFVFKGGGVRFPASMSGTMVSYLIPTEQLEQAVATRAISDKSYAKVSVPGVGDLVVDLKTAVPTDPKSIPDSIIIKVSGAGTVIAKAPVDKIKGNLIGASRRTFSESLSGISEIENARFSLTPIWAHRFPATGSKIEIITK